MSAYSGRWEKAACAGQLHAADSEKQIYVRIIPWRAMWGFRLWQAFPVPVCPCIPCSGRPDNCVRQNLPDCRRPGDIHPAAGWSGAG